MTTAHKVSAQGDFFFWLWDKHLVHFSRLVPNQSRHQTLWRYLRGAPGTAGIRFHWLVKIFLCSPQSKEFQRLQKLSARCKDFTAAFGSEKRNTYPTSLILGYKRTGRKYVHAKKKKIFWFLTQSPDYYLLFMEGRWDCLHISDLILPVWAHEVRKMAGRETQLLPKNTNFNFLTSVPRSCSSVPQTHQAQTILCFPFALTFCQQQLFFLSLLAFHLISPSKQP